MTIHHFLLPFISILYLIFCFLWPLLRIKKKIGKSPLTLHQKTGLQKWIGQTFLVLVLTYPIVVIFFLTEDFYPFLIPIFYLREITVFIMIGYVLLFFSIFWSSLAQYQMGESWRIGIDEVSQTEFVQHGLYRYSRNPIYFGMLLGAIGFFLVIPNAITLTSLALGYFSLKCQILLEEEYLQKAHPEKFQVYKSSVGRWIRLKK